MRTGLRPHLAARSCRWLVLLGLLLGAVPRAWADGTLSGTWQGSYVCAQGHTALTLVLRPVDADGGLHGFFYFHASSANPGVPDGCFAMGGTFDASSREIKLSARHWLLQPFGYVTVDLDGRLAPGGDRLSGQVIGPLCTNFDLHQAAAGFAAIPSPCLTGDTIALR